MKKTTILISDELWEEIKLYKPKFYKVSSFYEELIKKGLEEVKNGK